MRRLVGPLRPGYIQDNITACILDTFTELDKALFRSRQYVLTLWPAFVGFIVAQAPDLAYMVYDTAHWAALFSLTCGNLLGMQNAFPPLHVEAVSEEDGQVMFCEAWKCPEDRPRFMS